MTETIEGFVENIIYRNEENGYTVFLLRCHEREITCTGVFPGLDAGESLRADGNFKMHPSYGEQFQVTGYALMPLRDTLAQERYLASGAIKGIGQTLAARIVRKFGEDSIRILEEEPERLAEVKGISERMASSIGIQAADRKDMRDAMLFLQDYGIPMKLALAVYHTYGDALYGIIKKNPYRLADDMTGVGFRTADEIARRAGIRRDSDFRICSGILYELTAAAAQGHTCLPEEILTERAAQMLGVEEDQVDGLYMDMAIDHRIHMVQGDCGMRIYAEQYYRMEENAAFLLTGLCVPALKEPDEVESRLEYIARESRIRPDDAQKEAVRAAASNGLLVLTGGPGTGKTTTIRLMLRYFEEDGDTILLAAPTGRAARRMSEATGYPAQTIHRMLQPVGDLADERRPDRFEHNEEYPLEADVIIIDEMSMVDISLMYALLRAIKPPTRLVLVGDVNQLPSVGAGNVLRDIIDARICSTVCLTHIFRQASQSDIVLNAHRINRGEMVPLDNKSRDFFFLKRYEADTITGVCVQLIRENLPKYLKTDPYEIQLLTPTRKGLLGVEHLNPILQQYLNPPDPSKAEMKAGTALYREGDKVMQIRNNYHLEWKVFGRYGTVCETGCGVFNGDTGVVKSIDRFLHTMTVEYEEGRCVEYQKEQMDELEPAYAITVHKAQGSEYPAVILPLLGGPQPLLTRNLLYTALTRAQRCVVVVGDERVFEQMVRNDRQQKRYSGFRERILYAIQSTEDGQMAGPALSSALSDL